MGWWPSIFGGGADQPADPLKSLDPKLREFLEKESPVRFQNSQDKKPEPTTQKSQAKTSSLPAGDANAVPSQSLYPDGRYAHLWKNYRPQAEVEADAMSDHDRLMSILEGYQERKSQITKVAMENCAEAQEEWVNCMKHGKWEDQLQMCRHQVRRYEKCYTMQSRFLRALGYGSVAGRNPEVDDDIQMHADALYQRVLRHEEAVTKAKEAGTPIPVFDPRIPSPAKAAPTPKVQPTEELEQAWQEKLSQLPEEERPVEEAALRADLQAKSDVARTMKDFYESKNKNKDESGQPKPQNNEGKTVAAQLWDKFNGR